jgi:16S rRNA (cytosine967-C5)-methyltransferase
MTPAARLQTAIELLDEILTGDRPADSVMAKYFRDRRFIGGGDRRSISDQTWRVLRHRAELTWALGTEQVTGRLYVAADLARNERKSTDAIAGLFSGAKNGPLPLSSNERRMVERAGARETQTPREAKLECPAWLLAKFDAAFGADADKEVAALNGEADMDLRANTLKTTRDAVLAELLARDFPAAATPLSPFGIRVKERINLATEPSFRDGQYEVQDEGSQLCAALADARPGQAVMDYCAGAGGKTLAIAAAMHNKGRLVACDVNEKRLERSKLRLRRAGVHNATLRILEERDKWVKRQAGGFDRVVVDAPCSGTGAWRRNPDARWRFAPEHLERLKNTQDELLDQTAPLVKAGGRLAYITCSLLPEENGDRVQAFLARTPAFRVVPVPEVWAQVFTAPPPSTDAFLTLTPARNGTDGFFIAILERVA